MVVVILTVCITGVSVDIAKQVHLIRVAEHLRVRLPASPLALNVQVDGVLRRTPLSSSPSDLEHLGDERI